ncbi:MAG TPA: hypothetical protein PKJ97_02600, partial [Candidatus Bilamarchaeaceae archaeon]|nr:hypothetical protein [Candidatus Bilamarchaeaceae archaeon]
EFENYRLTLEDVLALTYLDRAYTFFTSTPNPTPEQVLAFYEGVLVAGQMTSRQNGREAATLEDVDRYIQAGLGSVGIGGAASRFLAAITSAETRMVERVAQNLYNYVYERRMAGVSGAPGEIPYERAARAAAQDARQAVQGLFDKIRSVPPEARGALNMNALLAEAGVAQDAMESMLARGSRERLMDMNRLNSIIRSPQFADPNSVRMVLEDGLPKVNIIRGSFTAAFDEAFIAPWRMVSEAWRGESSTLARVINAGGSVFAALTYRPLARGLRTTFGPRRAIGERVGGAAGLAVYGLVGWQVASWLGATERGPFTLAYNSLFGSSGASAPSAGVTAPPRPAVRTEATPALNEAQRDTQQRLVSVSDAYTSINDADPLLGGRISQFLTRAFGFETRTDYGLEANAQRVSRFDAARAQDAAEFMSMASAAMEGKAGNQAELAFYEAFFKFVTGSDNPRTLFIGNRFLPQAQRLDVYRELFDSTRVGRRGSLSNEAEIFEKMRRNPAFISAAGPVAQVIDAAVGAGRAQSASAERYL